MKLNEICLIITRLSQALIHLDSTVDYNVATGIAGMSVVGPTLLYNALSRRRCVALYQLEDASEDGVS